MKMEELLKQKQLLDDQLKILDSKYKKIIKEKYNGNFFLINNDDEINKLQKEMNKLDVKIKQINAEIEIEHIKPIIIGKSIDLYKINSDLYGYYSICLSGTKKIIGNIKVNYFNDYNNISYFIDEEFRNMEYAYNALCLLLDFLANNNFYNFVFIIDKDNIPSLKLAQKIMKKVDSYVCEKDNFYKFNFNINSKNNKKQKQ